MDISSGVSKSRKLQIQKEARTALLGDIVNFPISKMGDVFWKTRIWVLTIARRYERMSQLFCEWRS